MASGWKSFFVGISLIFVAGSFRESYAEGSGPGPVRSLIRLEQALVPTLRIDDADEGSSHAGSKGAFRQALKREIPLCKQHAQSFDFAGTQVSSQRWCEETARWFLAQLDSGLSLNEVFQKARTDLEWYQSTGKPENHEVQFTGYFFPVHRARPVPDHQFRYPLYRTPPDLTQPYFTREEIEDRGVIKGRGLEIAYLDNPVDPYILQVQGSGAVLLPNGDGTERRVIVNYASENGRPYASLGKAMRAAGIEESYINLQGIKTYFNEIHPELWSQFSNLNQSYVFFKTAPIGPYGYSGAILTPKHSIAVDKNIFPMGAIGVIQTERPDVVSGDQAISWKKFAQFVITQDTGGAIKSAGRVDVFWGEGPYAEVAAGRTDRTGNLYFVLVPSKKISSKK